MNRFAPLFAAAALAGFAAPAAGQYYPDQQYPYPQPSYPYPDQQYGAQNTIGAVIDSLIGNRGYDVSYRQAVHRCADAAVQRARYQYGEGYRGWNDFIRVTGINDVQRRTLVLRVRGTLGLGYRGGYGNGYGNGYGYGHDYDRYPRRDLSFRCDVDYSGYVRDVRLEAPYRY
jgi:hypothetical protein